MTFEELDKKIEQEEHLSAWRLDYERNLRWLDYVEMDPSPGKPPISHNPLERWDDGNS